MDFNLNALLKKINQFYLSAAIITLLGLYLIWKLYLFTDFLFSYNQEPEFLVKAQSYQVKVAPRATLPDLAIYNLFGVYHKAIKKTVKVSELNVTVQGIFASSDPKKGTVVIITNGKTKLYLVGDKIKEVAVIEEILDDKIIIDIDGVKEYIPYNNKNLEFSDNIDNQDFPPRIFKEE